MSSIPWFLKYRPKRISEVLNQEEAKEIIKSWLESWPKGKSKAVLLYGPPGVGKTTLAEVFAREYGFSLYEVNASDSRKIEDLRKGVERVAKMNSLFSERRLILMDEIDAASGSDQGFINGLIQLIEESKAPIILTANDPWDMKLRPLRDKVIMIGLKKINKTQARKLLEEICRKEKVNCEYEALDLIAERCEGDLRYAINSLEMLSARRMKVTKEDVIYNMRYKERTIDGFEMVRRVVYADQVWKAKEAVTSVDMDYETILYWLYENVPKQYAKALYKYRALDALSKASIYINRAKMGNWSFLSYAFDMMGGGVAVAKDIELYSSGKEKIPWVKYDFPVNIRMMSQTKEKREIKRSILLKVSKMMKTSSKALAEDYELIRNILASKGEELRRLGFTSEEIEFIMGEGNKRISRRKS